jgi:hypothetical protein
MPIASNSGRDPSGQALAVSAAPAGAVDGPSGFDPSRMAYIDRLHPSPTNPDWGDVEEVAQWIERTRWRAFFAGARGDEISSVEATALVKALSERTGE